MFFFYHGEPEEVAEAVLFLASDKASFMALVNVKLIRVKIIINNYLDNRIK